MSKIVAMIPARMGSKRVENKNTRHLGGIPLISHVIKATKEANCFDEIYVNSESEILGDLALEGGVSFYKRPPHLSSDTATNDDFTHDFLTNIKCDYLIQILPTSPFITTREIKDFTQVMRDNDIDTLISVKDTQIECIYEGRPINFNPQKPTPPSQELEPVQAYACALMGWKTSNFLYNMKDLGCAYHGGKGCVKFFTVKGFSEIDIDNEEDFLVAEAIYSYLNEKKN